MNKNQIELNIILISTYSNIILEILKVHKNLSVNKTLIFSYLIKKRKFLNSDLYSVLNKKDLVLKALSMLSGVYDDYCDNIQYIIPAIHLLVVNERLSIHEGELIYHENGELIIKENSFINNVIEESKKYSERQFLKEVVGHV